MTAMAKVSARATRQLDTPPDRVIKFLRNYREERPKILTDNYSAYRVEQGGQGQGTVIGYHFAAGGRERDYRLRAQEQDGVLQERDELSSFVSTWTVVATDGGSSVTLEASWDGAGGIGGIFEGFFAPLGLRRIYTQILDRLATALRA
jgi:hypothetical protein